MVAVAVILIVVDVYLFADFFDMVDYDDASAAVSVPRVKPRGGVKGRRGTPEQRKKEWLAAAARAGAVALCREGSACQCVF